jgi:hypothetical protein
MAGKLKTLFGKAAELEGRVSRRVGALGGKAKKEGDDVYSVADKAAPGGRRRARGEKGAAKSGKANEVKDLTSSRPQAYCWRRWCRWQCNLPSV